MNATKIGICPECGAKRELMYVLREQPDKSWRAAPICPRCWERNRKEAAK